MADLAGGLEERPELPPEKVTKVATVRMTKTEYEYFKALAHEKSTGKIRVSMNTVILQGALTHYRGIETSTKNHPA